jgi:hypothetical protein
MSCYLCVVYVGVAAFVDPSHLTCENMQVLIGFSILPCTHCAYARNMSGKIY